MESTTKAGLHPTADQIELFSYQLPHHSLSNLIQIFMSICTIDNSQYFLCNFEEIRVLAETIDHIQIPLKAKYTFVTSPISTKYFILIRFFFLPYSLFIYLSLFGDLSKRKPFVVSCFVKMVRMYSNNTAVTIDNMKTMLSWPFKKPTSLKDLMLLEDMFDVLDLYLWLSFRFGAIFCQREDIILMRNELEEVIFEGDIYMTLLKLLV